MPRPGNPSHGDFLRSQSLNRYAYVLDNPLRYTDPTGHWVETAWDIANIAWDIAEVAAAPTPLNIGALIVDVAAMVLPGVPGGASLLARGGKATSHLVTHADEMVDAVRLVNRAADATAGLRRFQEVGTDVVPDLLKAFGDGGRVVGKIPPALSDTVG